MIQKYLSLINAFANDLSLSKDIKVDVGVHHTSMTAVGDGVGRYEDVVYLSDTIRGAERLLYYLERNGYEITGGKSGRDAKRKDKSNLRRKVNRA